MINSIGSRAGVLPLVIQNESCFSQLCQRIARFCQSIFNALQRILCGGSVKRSVSEGSLPTVLAGFNNPYVTGQIHGIYITTNETNLAAARQLLARHPRPPTETIHIGCAAWHNLDIMCARKSTYGLIVDFNPENRAFIQKTLELILLCETRESFKNAIIAYLNSLTGRERELFFHPDQTGSPLDRIERELFREGSWLQNDENYLYVKNQIASKGRLVPITEDITSVETFSKIREVLDTNRLAIDTLYMSNICHFMKQQSQKMAFAKTIRHLHNNNTIVIQAPNLIQNPVLGREITD